jgi:hypothetical protein
VEELGHPIQKDDLAPCAAVDEATRTRQMSSHHQGAW